ncbi:Uncharacterised protein [Streptococcus pneumoniae]|nr:Uncharacterised protein [Streptococcus pneumoniae]COE88020.1 Uncharacterised protein [Streptococcus pneumoniae]COE90937.1 Uncharacterised protein [Streptococcus pneumoniae]COF39252.1 Uncharacterised protein [Streptococcus pneumoniae]COP67179.1 Uncharacterised protein [Streptococcus pneumoniae]
MWSILKKKVIYKVLIFKLNKSNSTVSVNGKRTGMNQRFMLIHERSIKELTRAADSSPSWHFLKTNRFGDANRRGSPSRIEGLGSSIDGVKGKISPCRFGQSPRSFCHAKHGSAKPTSVADPYGF